MSHEGEVPDGLVTRTLQCDFVENADGTWSVGTKDSSIKLREAPIKTSSAN
jgi:hypothetical protein